MTTQEREKIISVISDGIKSNERLMLRQLHGIFRAAGLDPRLYAATGPKRWIQENFSSEFFVMGSNGYEQIVLENDPIGKIWRILDEKLSELGRIAVAAIPGYLNPPNSKGYQWAQFAQPGQRLSEWLRATFLDFALSGDNSWLTRKGVVIPPPPPPVPPTTTEEIQQMHAVAFMNWWSENIKKLHSYNSKYSSEEEVRSIVAHQFARALMGEPDIVIDARNEDDPRVAVDTGLKDQNDQIIFCILVPNPMSADNGKQPWVMSDFACADDGSLLGAWLKNHGVGSERSTAGYAELEESAMRAGRSFEEILPLIDAYVERLRDGKIPANSISKEIADLEAVLADLKVLYNDVWGEPYPEDATISEIVEQASGKSAISKQINNCINGFDDIADKVQDIFTKSKLPNKDTVQADKEAIHQQYGGTGTVIDLSLFENTLSYYRAVFEVASASELSDEVDSKFEMLRSHFSEIYSPYAVFAVFQYELEEGYLEQVDALEGALGKIKRAVENEGRGKSEKRFVTAEELLQSSQEIINDGVAAMESARSVYPNGKLEKMLVGAQCEAAKEYLTKHQNDWPDAQEMLDALTNTAIPLELTYFSTATRLYNVMQNRDRLAEKYYILGLSLDKARCAPALLRLYREEGNTAAFREVVDAYFADRAMSIDDQLFYLSILCDQSPEAAVEYAGKYCYLFYQDEILDLLESLPTGIFAPDVEEYLTERKTRLREDAQYDYNAFNALEKAIVDGNVEAISSLSEDRYALGEMGYSEEEIDRITNAAEKDSGASFRGKSEYDIGCRLYAYQKNNHRLAERYMWKGIARERSTMGTHLMLILAQEERWTECCRLFTCFEAHYSNDTNCRQLYFVSLLRLNNAKTKEYITANLQDCLLMINSVPIVKAALSKAIEASNNLSGEMYPQLLQLSGMLSDPFVKSVVVMDRTLREYASAENAEALGLPTEIASSINDLYMTDNYPHGKDAISISDRAYRFLGTYKGVSEAFARFALPDARAVDQLWTVYCALDDESLLFDLLLQYPQLQKEHTDRYLRLLFKKENYAAFVSACETEVPGTGLALQLFIAELKLDPKAKISLPDISFQEDREEYLAWFCEWGRLLIATLAECERIEDLKNVLFAFFDTWVDAYPKEKVRQIVTGNSTVKNTVLSAIQSDALVGGHTELALYIYNVLHVGDMKELSASFLEVRLQDVDQMNFDDKLKALSHLQTIYGGSLDKVDEQMSLLKIQSILSSQEMTSTAEEIGAIIKDFPANDVAFKQLLQVLDDSSACRDYNVYKNLESLSVRAHAQKTLTVFCHNHALAHEKEASDDFIGFVCQNYIHAFSEGWFPNEILQEAFMICADYTSRTKSPDGILCLYFIEKQLGKNKYACYLLRVLADHSAEILGNEMGEIVSDQIKFVWGDGIPSYLELFKDVLNAFSIEEIEKYIEFAHITASLDYDEGMQGIATAIGSESGRRMLSENDSNTVVRLLFNRPKDAAAWRYCMMLPIQDDPVGYAKLLFFCGKFNPGTWKNCAEYCEKYEQYDLLLNVFLAWASDGAESCRKYLETRLLEQPNYFLKWVGNPILLDIIKKICDGVKLTEMGYHATLRSVSLIAVKSAFPEAITYLMDKFGYSLLGNCCNLGVVVAVHLVLDSRFKEARELFGMLKNVLGKMNYREMVDSLSRMTEDELEQWATKAENRIMLNIMLPDGNSPSLQQINDITYDGIRAGQARETAEVLQRILYMFPDDYGIYNALFDLSCTQFDGYLPVLHTALRGLVRLRPNHKAASYYRRDEKTYAYMLAVLDELLVRNNLTDNITEYDFKTDDYCRKVGGAVFTPADLASVTQIRKTVQDNLNNRSDDEVARRTQAYLSCITYNWVSLLESAWKDGIDIQYELNCKIGEEDVNVGLARSMLRLLAKIEYDRRSELVSWIKSSLQRGGNGRQSARLKQVQFVEKFLAAGCFDKLEAQTEMGSLSEILNNPFEDYSLFEYMTKQYVDLAVKSNSSQLFAVVWLIGALINYKCYQTELAKKADEQFATGNDEQACGLYHALYNLIVGFGTSVPSNGKIYEQRLYEQYEAKYRLAALFLHDKEITKKVGSSDFHVWSCINLVLTLVASPRADEVLRLAEYLSRENAAVANALLRGLDPSVDDEEKLKLIDTISGNVAKAYYCYVLKYPYTPYKAYSHALAEPNTAKIVNDKYLSLLSSLDGRQKTAFDRLSPRPRHLLLLPVKVHPNAHHQKDPKLWNDLNEMTEGEEVISAQTPSFAIGLEPAYAPDVAKLIEDHKHQSMLHIEQRQQRQALSRQIYQHHLACGSSQADIKDALLLYGNDCYYVALTSGEHETANQTIFEVAKLLRQRQSAGYGYEEATKTIPNALFELIRSYTSLQDLLDSYSEHKSIFHYMRSFLRDPLLLGCLRQIFAVLDKLINCYSNAIQDDPETLIRGLSDGYRQLEVIETNAWMELKNNLQKLITNEINELDRRPNLKVEILNHGVQRTYGDITGQVTNIGSITAENIILQAYYGNGSHSSQHALNHLSPGAKAVFEIAYGTWPDAKELEYYINISFSYEGKTHTSVADKGVLALGVPDSPEYDAGILTKEVNGMQFSVDEETGEIFNPDFIGRKKEKKDLIDLVDGDDFATYKSALVYGIRRTGKTSLLHFIETYISAHRKNIICISVDCQTLATNNFIQFVFIKSVINKVEQRLPELRDDNEWDRLKRKWDSDGFCADQHPEMLSLFYTDIKARIGDKGLYLIIDEIDRLFEKVESQSTLDVLFGSISAMLNSLECKRAVHFIICGSNWLIRYDIAGDKTKRPIQFIQRFGKQVIEVGKLPAEDAADVIRTPYKKYPELYITPEAIDWIWSYTNGMVWHTKVLGAAAIQRAKNKERNVVYPYDVQASLEEATDEKWCKQFYEGCESGAEYRLVDAMQSLASKRDEYIHVNQLSELLNWPVIDVQKTMAILGSLKIVAQHPMDQQLYRFEQDIYRRYFRSVPVSEFRRVPDEPEVFYQLDKARVSAEKQTAARSAYGSGKTATGASERTPSGGTGTSQPKMTLDDINGWNEFDEA